MAMKLFKLVKVNKICTICDNEDYCITFICLELFGDCYFSRSFLKKISFQLRFATLTRRHRWKLMTNFSNNVNSRLRKSNWFSKRFCKNWKHKSNFLVIMWPFLHFCINFWRLTDPLLENHCKYAVSFKILIYLIRKHLPPKKLTAHPSILKFFRNSEF